MSQQYDAILFDAGGVFLIPDPAVLAPTLAYYGATTDEETYVRAHYGAMAAKSRQGSGEDDWSHYNNAYVQLVGVPEQNRDAATFVLSRTRHAHLWRAPLAGSAEALRGLNAAVMDVGGATAAGLIPILVDPYNDATDLVTCRRIASLLELL